MKKQKAIKLTITPASKIKFHSPDVKRAFQKVEEHNKVISKQSKIDQNKLSLCISV
jgi:hypothetical protein